MATSEDRLDALMGECQRTVIDAIIGPFGLSGIIFSDKDGGDVDAIHNVRATHVAECQAPRDSCFG